MPLFRSRLLAKVAGQSRALRARHGLGAGSCMVYPHEEFTPMGAAFIASSNVAAWLGASPRLTSHVSANNRRVLVVSLRAPRQCSNSLPAESISSRCICTSWTVPQWWQRKGTEQRDLPIYIHSISCSFAEVDRGTHAARSLLAMKEIKP